MVTLKDLIFSHDNDYNFEPSLVIDNYNNKRLSSLSIVIPYFELGELFKITIDYLQNAIQKIIDFESGWNYEIIVVDDGSKLSPATIILADSCLKKLNIRIITCEENRGRSIVRQIGLEQSHYEKVAFMDADILIHKDMLFDHLKLLSFHSNVFKTNCITVSFFHFIELEELSLDKLWLNDIDFAPNDYRLSCVFEKSWVLGDRDEEFIGQHINIVTETTNFKSWKGWFKAWLLPNMILGGFFICDRRDALDVGGFNNDFEGYGFTETTLPSKLIGLKSNHVIPYTRNYAIHVNDSKISLSRSDKDLILRNKYAYYHQNFLMQEITSND